jgi:hypothetical protein
VLTAELARRSAVHRSQQGGLFGEQFIHAREIACQSSGFDLLVELRVANRKVRRAHHRILSPNRICNHTRVGAGANTVPLVGVKRVADAPRDRAGLNVTVIDMSAIGALRMAGSGEGGHAVLKRDRGGSAIGVIWVGQRYRTGVDKSVGER